MAGPGHQHGHGMPSSMRANCDKLPVIVLTGYLGAGKTTLLNYLLSEQKDKKLAVIENEIGEVSIDDALVEVRHQDMAEELVVLDNGCICCTIRGDLVQTLNNIAVKHQQGLALDGVLIELTGAADPAPVVQTFFMDDDVCGVFYVDNVVALVDAKHAIDMLDESEADPTGKGTACTQIAFSSAVLLNKIDLVDSAGLDVIEKRIKAINSTVRITRCQEGRVPVAELFDVGAFQLDKVLEEQYMDEEEFNQFYKSKMDRSISNVGVRCTGALSMFAFQHFLNKYLGDEEDAKDFLRVKGVLDIKGSDFQFVLQCVHMVQDQAFTKHWGSTQKGTRENRIIFIGRNMQQRRQELTEGFLSCVAKPLRFAVGAQVRAKTGDGENDYENGTVTHHWDNFMTAYRIKLRSGEEVHAPLDDDSVVMALPMPPVPLLPPPPPGPPPPPPQCPPPSPSRPPAEVKTEADDKEPPMEGHGGKTDTYTWTQTLSTVEVFIPVRPGVKAGEIVCDIGADTVKMGVEGEPVIINGQWHAETKPDGCTWTLVDDKVVQISLEKHEGNKWWSCVIQGDSDIDTKKM